MQIKRVMCPNCRTVLDVKNLQNEAAKQITCPSCKTILKVKFKSLQKPVEAPTFVATPRQPAGRNAATQLVGGNSGATQLVGENGATLLGPSPQSTQFSVSLFLGGKEYVLAEGRNIVGRKASTSNAGVQIETSDRYMSRQHCSITVTTLSDGTKKVVLSNYQNKNQTVIDGQSIETGDTIRLTDGNNITMGRTTVTFKITKE